MYNEKLQIKEANNNLEEEQRSLADLEICVDNEISVLETKEDALEKGINDIGEETKLVVIEDAQLLKDIDSLKSQMENIDHEKDIIVNESSENE